MNHGVLDVDQGDATGYSPLCVAAQKGNATIVQLLIDNKADVDKADRQGVSPMMAAELNGHMDVVGILAPHIDESKVVAKEIGRKARNNMYFAATQWRGGATAQKLTAEVPEEYGA